MGLVGEATRRSDLEERLLHPGVAAHADIDGVMARHFWDRWLRHLPGAARRGRPAPPPPVSALRWLAAELLLGSAAATALDAWRHRPSPRYPWQDRRGVDPLVWGGAALGAAAAAAQLARLRRPTAATRRAAQLLSAAAAGAAAAELARSAVAGARRRSPVSLTPLLFTSAGVLGLLLDWHDAATAASRPRPKPRPTASPPAPRVERIVIHV